MGEGLGQFGGGDFWFAVEFGVYEQAGEEGLVPGSLGDGVGFVVGLAGLVQELPRERETPFGRSVSAFGGVEFGLDGGDLAAEFLLFFGEEVERYGAGEVGVEEPPAFGLEAGEQGALPGELSLAVGEDQFEGLHEPVFEFGDAGGVEGDGAGVVAGDGLLDGVLGEVGLLTGLAGVAGAAHEVAVEPAAAAADLGEAQAAAAVAAVDGALEVVDVAPVLVAGEVVVFEDLLDLGEGRGVDEGRVIALVVDSAEVDDPDVVDVLEQPGERRSGDLGRRVALGFAATQPAFPELLDELVERVLAGGVGGERPCDERGAFVVDDDAADVVGAVPLADVEVAKRDALGGAAVSRLLDVAVDDLSSEVARVEGVDRGEDAGQEHALGGVVDVLGDGDQLAARGTQLGERGEVRELVAGEAVESVDDEVGDVAALAHEGEDLAQRAVEALAGRLGGGHEFPDDVCLELGGVVEARAALELHGVALFGPGPPGLPGGGDP